MVGATYADDTDNSQVDNDLIQLIIHSRLAAGQYELQSYFLRNPIYKKQLYKAIFERKEQPLSLNAYSYAFQKLVIPALYKRLLITLEKEGAQGIAAMSTLTGGKIAVIGKLKDTGRFRSRNCCDVITEKNWTRKGNIQWLQAIIDSQGWVYLASPLIMQNLLGSNGEEGEHISFFGFELKTLMMAGYQLYGSWLVPPWFVYNREGLLAGK